MLLNTQKTQAAAFTINLNYDAKSDILRFDKLKSARISFDKDQEIDIREYFDKQDKIKGDYLIKIVDAKDYESEVGYFNKKAGSFKAVIPYYSVGKTLNIYEVSSSNKILSVDISSFLSCNSNGICEYEKGENLTTCIDDCGTSSPKYSDETQKLLEENGNIIKDPQTGEVLLKTFAPASSATTPESKTSTSAEESAGSLTPVEQQEAAPRQNNKSNSVVIIITVLLLLVIGIFITIYLLYIRKNKE